MKKLIMIILGIVLLEQIVTCQWIQQNGGTNLTLYNVKFLNLNTGWITGVNGIILKTTNGGANWIMQNSNLNQPRILTGIDILDENSVYIVGWYSAVLKTTNGGENWIVLREMPVGQGNSYNDIDFVNEQLGWFCGFQGLVWKTTNSGLNWDSVNVGGGAPLRDIYFINDQTGWTVGDGGFMRQSTNGGMNWISQFTGVTADFDYNSLSFVSSNTGWIAANNNSILRTTNSGINWIIVSQTPGRCLHFVNELTGWTGGSNGDLYKTTNGGFNFYLQSIPVTGGFFTDIEFVNDSTGWAIDVYVILKTTNGGTFVGLEPISGNVPNNFVLHQNYPNPFNPNTTIQFAIPREENVKLAVYDILGKEIDLIIDKKLKAGNYNIIFNGERLSSGIYFYSLQTNTAKITKKMILNK
jgi:photosystem II stability/assembly factor-like uncharacterized protein